VAELLHTLEQWPRSSRGRPCWSAGVSNQQGVEDRSTRIIRRQQEIERDRDRSHNAMAGSIEEEEEQCSYMIIHTFLPLPNQVYS
jgi:hypothetical protein